MNAARSVFRSCAFLLIITLPVVFCDIPRDTVSAQDGTLVNFPITGEDSENVDYDLCPQGAQVLYMFLGAWQKEDYQTMYELIDDESKKDYPFEEAKFDFMFMKFVSYKISSIKKNGENFNFILSYGDWKYGTKELRKVLISGKTFKIIMTSRGSIFEKSVDSYF